MFFRPANRSPVWKSPLGDLCNVCECDPFVDRLCLRDNVSQALSGFVIAGSGLNQDELKHQVRTVYRNLLCNHSADGEAENVDLL